MCGVLSVVKEEGFGVYVEFGELCELCVYRLVVIVEDFDVGVVYEIV